MTISPATVMPLVVAAFLAGVPAVLAQTDQPRRTASAHMSFKGQAARPASRARPALPRAPTQAEKEWMDRASSASNGGGGGGM
jgi:hypothetical protein